MSVLSPTAKFSAFNRTTLFGYKETNHNYYPGQNPIDDKAPGPIQYQVQDPIGSFTPRDEFLQNLEKAIGDSQSTEGGTVLSKTIVITGLGGQGKTETVREYVRQHKKEYGHILWINAEKYSQSRDCFKAIASLCNVNYLLTIIFDSKRAEIVDKIFEHVCQGEKPCLIVFDNAKSLGTADSKEGIQPFLPPAWKPKEGCKEPVILVTSRTPNWKDAGAGHVIQLTGLNEKECFKLLSDQLIFRDTPENRDSAEKIRKMCEGLPLVVQQVIAIIRATNKDRESLGEPAFTMQEFLSKLQGSELDLTDTLPADSSVGSSSFKIFKMAFKRILEQENGGIAFRCLSVMALLNPDGIPAKLLTSLVTPTTTDKTALAGPLNLLRDQNLVTLHNGSYRIHRIVQLVCNLYNNNKCGAGDSGNLKTKLKNVGKTFGGTPRFYSTSVDILTSIIPTFLKYLQEIALNEDSLTIAVFQNGLQIASHLKKHSEVEGNISFLEALAEKLDAAGKYSEAENIWEDLLAIYASGKRTSAEKWDAKSELAWACLQQGKHDAALKILKEVLETQESELGTDHEDTLSTKGMMAVVYQEQGKYDDAIELNEYVLKNEEIQFGSNHSRTAATKHNLAAALQESGKYERAFELYNDVLKYREPKLGPNHRSTLETIHNLTIVLKKMGKYDEAVKMFEDTLKGQESELGPNHVETLRTKSSLASALEDNGEDRRAFQLYEETLKDQTTHLGPDHTHTLITKHNFAWLHKKRGNFDTAVEMFEDVLKRREKVLDPNHQFTISTKKVLADILYDKEEYERASELYEEVLKFQLSFCGPNSPETLVTNFSLANSFTKMGKYGAAMDIYQQILEHEEKSLGPNHPDTLGIKHNMAWNLRKQGRYDEALRACEDILNSLKQDPDVIYNGTMGIKDEIARIYTLQGKYEDAVELFEEVLEHYSKKLGPSHPLVKNTEQRLQEAREKKANRAEELDRNVTS